MKGDFTRSTFQPNKHYTSVRMQQGRLQLDSDWNEQVDIEAYLRHAQAVDMIGADSGVPTSRGDSAEPYRDSFKISVTPDGSDLAIAPGRLYANGTFCELEATPLEGTFTASNRIQVNTLIADGRQLEKSQWIEIAPENNPDLKASVQIAEVNIQTLELTLNLDSEKIKADLLKVKDYTEKVENKSQGLRLRRVVTYNTQPDYIKPEERLTQNTIYLVYVDVWQRHITAIEDPTIREVALNGSDTTTRIKTIWQIKLKKIDELINEVGGEAVAKIQNDFQENEQLNNLNAPAWESLIQQVWGNFLTQKKQRKVLMNACTKLCSSSGSQSNGIGYQRLENLLYRVEIYEPSQTEQGNNQGNNGTNKATFKWSRDNGSVVSSIEKIEGNVITIRKSSQDAWMSSRAGQWIEITNEEMELKGQPGVMVPLSRAFDTKIEFNESRIVNGPIPNNPTTVRLWSHDAKKYPNGAVPIADDWIELETGIKVKFCKDSVYRNGDYWLIPARNATNDIEWPHNQAESQKRQPLPQPPKGIHHDYCPLALVQFDGEVKDEEEKPEQEEQESKTIRDLRIIFPPLMRCLDTAGGIISGTLEVQSGLYVTRRYDKNEKRYITGKLGVGTKKPLARLHVESPTAIPAEEKISSRGNTVTGIGDTFKSLGIDDAIIIRDSLGKIQTRIVTSPPSDFEGKSLEIDAPFDSDLENVKFEYQPASDRTLDIVRLVDRDQTIQLLVNAEGKVGIGTSTPCNQLDVLGGVVIGQAYAGETKAPDNGLLVDGTVSIGSTLPSDATNFKLYVNGNIKGNSITAKSGIFRSQEGANLAFQTGDTTQISVASSSGNVGIGIDPDTNAKLNLGGTLKLTNNDQTAAVSLQIDKTNSENWLQFTATNLTGYSCDRPIKAEQGVVTNRIENYNNQSLILQTNDQDRIAIAHDTGHLGITSNVGIGLSNPTQKLIVENGNVGIGYNDSEQSAMLAVKDNVGIGITKPNAQLHVIGTVQVDAKADTNSLIRLTQNNHSISINWQDDELQFVATSLTTLTGYSFDRPITAQQGIVTNRIENHNSESLILQTNNQDRIAIANETGNVGVGIDPDTNAKLNLAGALKLTNNDQTAAVSFQIHKTDRDNWLQFTAPNLTGYSFDQTITAQEGVVTNSIKSHNNDSLILQTSNQDRIAIAHDTGHVGITSNVGIGGSNPAQKLVVENGKVGIGYNDSEQSAMLAVKETVGIGITKPNAELHVIGTVQVDAKADANPLIKLTQNDQSFNINWQDGELQFVATSLKGYSFDRQIKAQQGVVTSRLENYTNENLILQTNSQNLILRTDNQDRITIDQDGKVGIGTPDSPSQLDINGTAKATQLEGNSLKLNDLTVNQFSNNSNLTDNEQSVPTEKAVKAYVETEIHELSTELQASNEEITRVKAALDDKAALPGDPDVDFNAKSLNAESIYAKKLATTEITPERDSKGISINAKQVLIVGEAVSNGFYQVSSRALKEDINDLSSQEVAALLRALNPVKFIYTEDESKTAHAGFIAEDTPDLLTSNEKQSIKVVDIVAILTKVVQDHRKTLTDLVKVVRKQQSEIATLTQKVKELEEKTEQ